MKPWHDVPITLLTCLVQAIGRMVQGLSDESLVRLSRLARPFVRGEARAALDEAIGVLQAGPPYTTLVREMLGRSRDEELWDLLWGVRQFRPLDITAAGPGEKR